MAPLIKVKVINMVKCRFGHHIKQNDPNELINKVPVQHQTCFQAVLHCCSIKRSICERSRSLVHMRGSCAISKVI